MSFGVPTTYVAEAITNIKLHMDLIARASGLFVGTPAHLARRPIKKGEGILWLVRSVMSKLCSQCQCNVGIAAAHDKAEQPFLNKKIAPQ